MLWSQARGRLTAVLVSAAYFLSASRGLPQGVVNYYGADGSLGLVLWLAASLAFVSVYGALWSRRAGWHKPFRLGTAMLLMSVPPFGIVGWASPIPAAGILFPEVGWFGLALCFAALLLLATPRWPVPLAVVAVLWVASVATWVTPSSPPGWVGIDTHFQGVNGQYAGYEQERQTIGLVQAAIVRGYDNILLPESALGIWTPTVEHLWTKSLAGTNATVVAGAVVLTNRGYDNVMVELSAHGARILYHDRMPVPVAMWQPWLSWIGQAGGARADFFANPAVSVNNQHVALLICYEQLLVWPVLQSMLYRPELLIGASNDWWTRSTNIALLQRAVATAWARLFSAPVIFANNV